MNETMRARKNFDLALQHNPDHWVRLSLSNGLHSGNEAFVNPFLGSIFRVKKERDQMLSETDGIKHIKILR